MPLQQVLIYVLLGFMVLYDSVAVYMYVAHAPTRVMYVRPTAADTAHNALDTRTSTTTTSSAQKERSDITSPTKAVYAEPVSSDLPTPSTTANTPSPRVQTILHGAFPDFGPTEDVVSQERVRDFERLVEKEIAWGYFSDNWFDGISFPQKEVEAMRAAGSVPFIRIMPRSNFYKQSDPVYSLTALVEGEYDSDLRSWMRDAALVPGPLLVEFGTEMNGNWFPWSGHALGGGTVGEYGDPTLHDGPELFVDAYRHLVDIAREEGAHNIIWFLHYNLPPAPPRPWNSFEAYYPGDEYVDWLGISVYGAQVPNTSATPASTLFARYYEELRAVAPEKPLAVLEFGAHGDENAAEWLTDFFDTIENEQYDVDAIALWHSNWTNRDGSESQLRIDANDETLAVYRTRITSDRYTSVWNATPE